MTYRFRILALARSASILVASALVTLAYSSQAYGFAFTTAEQRCRDAAAKRTVEAWTSSDDPAVALRSSLRELWRVRAELSDEAKVVADLLAQSLHEDAYERDPGLARFVRDSGLPFEAHEEFKKPDLDARQDLYRRLAEDIWNPDRLAQEAES